MAARLFSSNGGQASGRRLSNSVTQY